MQTGTAENVNQPDQPIEPGTSAALKRAKQGEQAASESSNVVNLPATAPVDIQDPNIRQKLKDMMAKKREAPDQYLAAQVRQKKDDNELIEQEIEEQQTAQELALETANTAHYEWRNAREREIEELRSRLSKRDQEHDESVKGINAHYKGVIGSLQTRQRANEAFLSEAAE